MFRVAQLNFVFVFGVGTGAESGASGLRWLLTDARGQVLVLAVHPEAAGGSVSTMTISAMGESSTAEAICFLNNDLCFVGSAFGDSQLLKLPSTSSDSLSVVESFDNLGIEILSVLYSQSLI